MIIADLHIHSQYSRATSRDCDLPHLDLWARYKGIQLIGTGDFTHPAWREEMQQALVPAEDGLYRLKEELVIPHRPLPGETAPRFVVTGEISSIYKKNGRTRKVHNLIVLPGLEAAETLSHKLEAIGNIRSDGRPILGLDSRDLLEITLTASPEAMFVPAHIWTPHFSVFGAFSGFDTMEECFEDLTPYIHALETGLSSDPAMNWRVSMLDGYTLISNSDAHSPAKLGREANLLDIPLSYANMKTAVETGTGFCGTVEFFPEEGKYHLDGHRACNICLEPSDTVRLGGLCPVCGKKLTIGVQHRVEELADRPEGHRPAQAKPFESLAPLPEVIGASLGVSAASRKVQAQYAALLEKLGPEFYILREAPISAIQKEAGLLIAKGVERLREGHVERSAGYDGVYGVIHLFDAAEREAVTGQTSLLAPEQKTPKKKKETIKKAEKTTGQQETPAEDPLAALNPAQYEAAAFSGRAVAVTAGPGTGKTKTLIARILYLIREQKVKPGCITAVTFTNQAANEMKERLTQVLGKRIANQVTVGTFHKISSNLLDRKPLLGEKQARQLVKELLEELQLEQEPGKALSAISAYKNGAAELPQELEALYAAYEQRLHALGMRDLDDLLLDALKTGVSANKQFTHLLVDEFQDANPLQHRLIRHWSEAGESLFVIGDADQSIYGFRGANADCFEQLAALFPELVRVQLAMNYRSAPEILNSALRVISHNPGLPRSLQAVSQDTGSVRLMKSGAPISEAIWVAKEIAAMTGGVDMLSAHLKTARQQARAFSEIAVVCRTRRQLSLIENCLRHEDIPCCICTREEYLQEDAVRAALGFFKTLFEPKDPLAWADCLSLWEIPKDLVEKTVALCAGMETPDVPLLEAQLGEYGYFSPCLVLMKKLLPSVKRQKPRKLLEAWCKAVGKEPKNGLQKLLEAAGLYDTMPGFLEAVTLGEEGELMRASGKAYASGAVRLMTIHGAKGLEFPVVFLCGIQKGTLPLERESTIVDVEEERRLLFVGMTRAKEELILTTGGEDSAFLSELPEDIAKDAVRERRKTQQQLSFF